MSVPKAFLDEEVWLVRLWRLRLSPDGTHSYCPRCRCRRAFRRYATTQRRGSWTCTGCGTHLHPKAGTIFNRSSTPLRLWMLAAHLMRRGKCSAKDIERAIGVSYSTAHRIRRSLESTAANVAFALLEFSEADSIEAPG